MRFKDGVNLELALEMVVALPLIDKAHADLLISRLAYITSAKDGEHMSGSKHYEGLALDLRTKDLVAATRRELVNALRKRLNGSKDSNTPYQVILETTHMHVEYDPQ